MRTPASTLPTYWQSRSSFPFGHEGAYPKPARPVNAGLGTLFRYLDGAIVLFGPTSRAPGGLRSARHTAKQCHTRSGKE